MRKLAIGVLALILSGAFAYGQEAVLRAEAEAHVYVNVVPNIVVGISDPNLDCGEISVGEFEAQVTFRVDANVGSVKIAVMATDLYKGDSPSSSWTIPVKRADGEGALVEPKSGNAMAGHGNSLAWLPGQVSYENGMNASESEAVPFESGQDGRFSQNVDVTIRYDQARADLPTGQYGGFVKLVAMIEP